jgi:hypothetical protein
MGPIGQPNVDLLKRIQNVSTSSEDIKPADGNNNNNKNKIV